MNFLRAGRGNEYVCVIVNELHGYGGVGDFCAVGNVGREKLFLNELQVMADN